MLGERDGQIGNDSIQRTLNVKLRKYGLYPKSNGEFSELYKQEGDII